MPLLHVLQYVGAGLLLWMLACNRVMAWRNHQDPDAAWHLLGLLVGCGLALAHRGLP